MIGWLMRRLAKRRCRNTRVAIAAEKAAGHQAQVIVTMIDKCTGVAYEAAFTVGTARQIEATLAEAIGLAVEMGLEQ